MNIIVMDLEFCNIGRKTKEPRQICPHEIIEIGAVKLCNGVIIDTFSQIVKPQYGHLNHQVMRLTKLTESKLNQGISYTEAMDAFLAWAGADVKAIYAWGPADLLQIQCESKLKNYTNPSLSTLIERWQDLQEIYKKAYNIDKISLLEALNQSQIPFEGRCHCALADATNTAKLLTQASYI